MRPGPDYPTRVSYGSALEWLRALAGEHRVGDENIALEAAYGRILAEDVVAGIDVPPFANAAMDGFALRGEGLVANAETRFVLAGNAFAGGEAPGAVASGQCVRITTGAPMPPGTDTVVIKEVVHLDGNDVVVPPGQRSGANVRAAGEDTPAGSRAASRGERLGAAALGVLATLGVATVTVARRPRVCLLATGDELVEPGTPLPPGRIYNSNRTMVRALLEAAGADVVSARHVRDEPEALREALVDGARTADVVLATGGVSAGEHDFLPRVIAETGRIHFWKVRLRPGMPFLCGIAGHTLVVGLPGNPVSVFATFLTLVRPTLRAMQGALDAVPVRCNARLAAPLHSATGRTEFLRGMLATAGDGGLEATPYPRQESGVLRSAAAATALIVVPEGTGDLAAGARVEVIPLAGLC